MSQTEDWLRNRLAPITGHLVGTRIMRKPDYAFEFPLQPDQVVQKAWVDSGHEYVLKTTIQFLASEFGEHLPPGILVSDGKLPDQAFDALLARCDNPMYRRRENGELILDNAGRPILGDHSNREWQVYWREWRAKGLV